MNQLKDLLRDLFDDERKRVFAPGPFFTQRVMTLLEQRKQREFGIWEMVPSSSRPVLAMALLLILSFVAIEMFVPREPLRGMIEAYIEAEQTPAETLLYSEAEVPSGQEFLEQMIALEEQK